MDGAQWHLLKHTLTNDDPNSLGSNLQSELTRQLTQPMVVNWPGLTDLEKSELSHTLSTTNNWILLTHPLGAKNKSQPPLEESLIIARAEGKCSRHKGWWREGKDELAAHSMTTEVWISTRGRLSEATRIALQEDLEEDD